LTDERAHWLAESVDQAYWELVERLPEMARRLAIQRGTFDHRSGDAPMRSLAERNAINTGPLFLFWELCQSIEDESLLVLALASAYSGLAYILLDHLVDNQTADASAVTLLQQTFHEKAIREYQRLFTEDHEFWHEFDRLSTGLRTSLALEAACRKEPERFSEESFTTSTRGKVSPAVLTITAATMLAADLGDQARVVLRSRIEAALEELICAGQLAHDIEEWRKDLAEGDMTFFLSDCASAEEWQRFPWPAEDEIERRMFQSRREIHYCQQAVQGFERAKEYGETIELDGGFAPSFANWEHYIDHYIVQSGQFAEEATKRFVKRVILGLTS